MNDNQIAKIARFLNDEVMSQSVKQAVLEAFLKPKNERDVNFLAASRIAIDLLEEAWKSLDRFRDKHEEEVKKGKQIGL